MTKLGAGTLTLAGANTHSGITTNGGGVLVLADPSALANSTLVMSGGLLGASAELSSGSGVINPVVLRQD